MEQFLKVAGITLRTIINEDFIDAQTNATRCKVILQDGFAQECITLLRAIATKTIGRSHFIGSLMHSLNNGRTERLRHITNAKRNNIGLGMHHLESVHLFGDIGKKVIVLQVQKVYIY